jgi:truncated hemoglobin YjbI
MTDSKSHFATLGDGPLRAITDELVERMAADPMIGFHFARVDLARLREFEYQHAAELLGGPVHYAGRPLSSAHAPHRIAGGHFGRRTVLLRQILERHGVPPVVRDHWLAQTEALRGEIVGNRPDCL